MDYSKFAKDLHLIWQSQPEVVVLLLVGFVIFLFLVADAHYYQVNHRRLQVPKTWMINFLHQTRNCRRPSLAPSVGLSAKSPPLVVETSTNPTAPN